MWDPSVYRRFGDQRSRPFADLVARVAAVRPRAVADLGCGPGELTSTLAQRWPQARIAGIDSSPEMIDAAVALGGPAWFQVGDLREWKPGPDVDVLISNAALQWVPEHRELLTRWVGELPPGAWMAIQVPANFDAPSHRIIRELAGRRGLAHLTREAPVGTAEEYAALLLAAGAEVDAWTTTYVHLLPDDGPEHPVLRWLEGTALRPIKAALDKAASDKTVLDENAWQDLRAEAGRELAAAYPVAHGHVAFPFRRIFVVARTAVHERVERGLP